MYMCSKPDSVEIEKSQEESDLQDLNEERKEKLEKRERKEKRWFKSMKLKDDKTTINIEDTLELLFVRVGRDNLDDEIKVIFG